MLSFDTYISRKLPLVGLISAVFIIYPNIACLPWDIKFLEGVSCTGFYWYFVYRFFFFYNRQIKKFPTEKQNVSLKHILT